MKPRKPPRLFLISPKQVLDQLCGLARVDGNKRAMKIDPEAGSAHFLEMTRSFVQADLAAPHRIILEGDADQAVWNAIAAHSLPVKAEGEFNPLALVEPPRAAQFLVSLVPIKHRENLLGDLEEEYRTRFIPQHGLRKAAFLYWLQAIYAFVGFLARPLLGIVGIGWPASLLRSLSASL
jgi:hypothetical protein